MVEDIRSLNRICFVGFGEAAGAFVTGWGSSRPAIVKAYDIKTANGATRAQMAQRYVDLAVDGQKTISDALENVEAVFSVVTADQALVAVEAAAPNLQKDALWLDCNSCAPATKRAAAVLIENAGGRYVDVAVMAPVFPKLHRVPLLVSGPHAEDAIKALKSLDMEPEVAGCDIGTASSVKMLRSVMIKGMEALFAECFLTAMRAGVADDVIASLEASNPEIPWRKAATYNLERMMVHGVRRAAEMREVAQTVRDLGLPGSMSEATAGWQQAIGELGLPAGEGDFELRANAILEILDPVKPLS